MNVKGRSPGCVVDCDHTPRNLERETTENRQSIAPIPQNESNTVNIWPTQAHAQNQMCMSNWTYGTCAHTRWLLWHRHRHRSRSSSLASAPPTLKAIPVCLRYAVTVLKMLPYQRKSGWNDVSKALTDWVCAFPVRSVVAVCTRRYITLTLCRRCREDK